ncbi:MAG TPA: acetyl-CoA carboxylase biotin carboxyl carrier protein subunit [Caldilineae bacterium]|nr:acetyl-CoA carboxylase biotin carboxyl carrier protein subunit [Caldilineae bacterium]
MEVDMQRIEASQIYSLLVDHVSHEVAIEETGHLFRVMLNGELFEVKVEDERIRRLASAGHRLPPPTGEVQVRAPIPGLITRVLVKRGDAVSAGQPVALLEAMKMENELRAPREGTVAHVAVQPGQAVEQGQVLVTIH